MMNWDEFRQGIFIYFCYVMLTLFGILTLMFVGSKINTWSVVNKARAYSEAAHILGLSVDEYLERIPQED